MLPAAAINRDLIEFRANIKKVTLPPTDHDPVGSDVDEAETTSTIISTFETLRILPLGAWSPARLERAAGSLRGSGSKDPPPSNSLQEYGKPEPAHPHPSHSSVHPEPLPPYYPSSIPLASKSPSVGTSVGVLVGSETGPPSGSRRTSRTEAALLQEFRLARFLEDPDENVMMRGVKGRRQDSIIVLTDSILSVFRGQIHSHETSSPSGFYR